MTSKTTHALRRAIAKKTWNVGLRHDRFDRVTLHHHGVEVGIYAYTYWGSGGCASAQFHFVDDEGEVHSLSTAIAEINGWEMSYQDNGFSRMKTVFIPYKVMRSLTKVGFTNDPSRMESGNDFIARHHRAGNVDLDRRYIHNANASLEKNAQSKGVRPTLSAACKRLGWPIVFDGCSHLPKVLAPAFEPVLDFKKRRYEMRQNGWRILKLIAS